VVVLLPGWRPSYSSRWQPLSLAAFALDYSLPMVKRCRYEWKLTGSEPAYGVHIPISSSMRPDHFSASLVPSGSSASRVGGKCTRKILHVLGAIDVHMRGKARSGQMHATWRAIRLINKLQDSALGKILRSIASSWISSDYDHTIPTVAVDVGCELSSTTLGYRRGHSRVRAVSRADQ
jgi:hypothetical protein